MSVHRGKGGGTPIARRCYLLRIEPLVSMFRRKQAGARGAILSRAYLGVLMFVPAARRIAGRIANSRMAAKNSTALSFSRVTRKPSLR